MSARSVRRFVGDASVVGGAIATAAMIGLGSAQAAPGDDVVDIDTDGAISGSDLGWLWGDSVSAAVAASTGTGTASSVDWLGTAVTNFTDANELLSSIDTSELSAELQGLVQTMDTQTRIFDTLTQALTDEIAPAESGILAHFGSLSGLVDQLFFEPYNQQWVDASESLLSASQALDSAIADGSYIDAMWPALQVVGVDVFQIIPATLGFIPIMIVGDVLGDATGDAAAGAASEILDFPF
jgi:hypothetical protein